jgi:hypothetical protein
VNMEMDGGEHTSTCRPGLVDAVYIGNLDR